MVRLKVQNIIFNYIIPFAFQFLMVRLKECTTKLMPPIIRISIPYGAIKRVGNEAFRYSQFEFQFLMVRLKVI